MSHWPLLWLRPIRATQSRFARPAEAGFFVGLNPEGGSHGAVQPNQQGAESASVRS